MSGPAQYTADGTIAAAAISSPIWVDTLAQGLHVYVVVGGAILLTLRIVKAVRDIKRKSE